ncbi:Oidioi.mRNA.OKI2018_I69.chr1.g2250.t1.cds [Oikopleura dioica]|uniref:Oidioi.mRNA.OKI2018_I69.chr1.g2250.t1.cds n=1 Tax=Oikopleura dioica TaxID=34765 RepID=A0ABN7SUR6_OIKDI|nr:Oidioi.mRNA.OKI2018_I69.chr1.g2250.t1.cds [Oikopleura dioica]
MEEITEFPAVLVNLSTGENVAEFHEFVRPTEHPELTDFCKKLTHLEKKDLSVEKSLQEVMVDFALWARDVQREHDLYFYTPKDVKVNKDSTKRICCICTWTDWDISTQLLNETKRKKIEIPEILKSWVDLRSVSRVYLQSVKKKMGHIPVLRKLFKVLKMDWEGKHHSGIDDARNTARLTVKMAANLKITRTLGVVGRIAGDPYRF